MGSKEYAEGKIHLPSSKYCGGSSSRLRFFLAAFFLLALGDALSPSLVAGAHLRPDYYADVCPDLESISVAHSPVAAPATLRLLFHDCAVRVRTYVLFFGCDASIMLINPDGDDEWRSLDGMTLKPEGFHTVMNAKAAVDSDPRCRNVVSCADILSLAARDSVFLSGGPDYQVELGRYDGRVSTGRSVVIPHGSFNLDQLNSFFSGLNLSQSCCIIPVILSVANGRSCVSLTWHHTALQAGAHTIGAASCGFFGYRMSTDTAMDPAFAEELRGSCPAMDAGGFAFLDAATPLRFDNEYYRNLRAGRGLLASDQALYADARSRADVDRYAADEEAFFGDFAAAMTRLGRVRVRTADDGEIRRDCRFPN
ncbi:hypothetical protein HU200_043161 [Digitaria exilis]|uniref:Peroxidase n=1 Tax=Digitaria exilis TaxID=1010633 RepID=A0A835B1P3_9POAL|nr:hypothetical protein HU200_043161 [Digitaria exilis]CAB3471282.1 unnamed protein product [Digitaria exilis]